MIERITGEDFKNMILNAAAAIEINKTQINDLNVFPVPDGDTGTNMSLTLNSGAQELKKASPASAGRASEITSSALLRGARGNSGVILSLLFRGIGKHLKDKDTADAMDLALAMTEGVNAAYKAVMKPTEGTILTVSRLAAAAAVEAAETETDIEAVFEIAIREANIALAKTIDENPVLKKAGVIDAGGKGYVYILEGMLKALRGEVVEATTASEEAAGADFSRFDTESITFMYCTEFIIGRANQNDPMSLRDFLDSHGDSIVVVDDEEIIKVHVHTNEPGHVLTKALTYGSLLSVKIDNMKEQHNNTIVSKDDVKEAGEERIAPPEKKFGVVAVCAGAGMETIFSELGADGIITGGQTMNPSTEDILKKINRTPAEIVYVLPNNKNIIMAAEQCIPLTEKKVIVIPTKTVPQGVSALLAFDPSASEEENTAELMDAIGRIRTAQITYAARNSSFDGHEISEDEYIALFEGSLISNKRDFKELLGDVMHKISEYSPEFITVYTGEDVNEEEANATYEMLRGGVPSAEVTLVEGGQPVYYYMISAE
jgi:DAK2 domain fusion protein YloV